MNTAVRLILQTFFQRLQTEYSDRLTVPEDPNAALSEKLLLASILEMIRDFQPSDDPKTISLQANAVAAYYQMSGAMPACGCSRSVSFAEKIIIDTP